MIQPEKRSRREDAAALPVKMAEFVVLFAALQVLLRLPLWIEPLGEWQRQAWEWNYTGTMANYILFILCCVYKRTSPSAYGVRLGAWGEHKLWYAVMLILAVLLAKAMDLAGGGALTIVIPSLSTIVFQLLFIALGEELLWRGTIQTEYGLWASAIGFGAMHMLASLHVSLAYALAYGVYTMLLGLLLAWTRKKTGSVYASAAAHGLYNLANHVLVAG